MGVSAAHVSATLAKAGYPRASEPADMESGFVVSVGPVENLGQTVIVAYQDYEYEGNYSDAADEIVREICEQAFAEYMAVLQACGYTVEKWMKYDGTQLGLFVTGREG